MFKVGNVAWREAVQAMKYRSQRAFLSLKYRFYFYVMWPTDIAFISCIIHVLILFDCIQYRETKAINSHCDITNYERPFSNRWRISAVGSILMNWYASWITTYNRWRILAVGSILMNCYASWITTYNIHTMWQLNQSFYSGTDYVTWHN
jgi:hypothetical protein